MSDSAVNKNRSKHIDLRIWSLRGSGLVGNKLISVQNAAGLRFTFESRYEAVGLSG